MLKFITHICRLLVGGLFVFSGFVKVVDPLGTTYKLEEYFGVDVLNLELLIPYALPIAIGLIIIELLLGISLLIGYKNKLTLLLLFLLTAFFLFLTGYSAIYDKVTDCGCFGDAVKLTPWETFYKNILFLAFISWMLLFKKHIQPIFNSNAQRWLLFLSCIGALYIIYQALTYLPLLDFRAYAVGKNIKQGMEFPENGDIPPVHDFYLLSETEELTNQVLNAPKAMLIVMNNLQETNKESWVPIKAFAKEAQQNGYLVYGLSSSSSEVFANTKLKHQPPFEILFCDATTLKTMMRANPGVLVLHQSNVIAKLHWKKLENFIFD